MASKAIQKSAAKKKILAASSTTSSAKTKVEIAGEKKENVAPESVEEVVESLISAVISKVEAEQVNDPTKIGATTNPRRRSSEPSHRHNENKADEAKGRCRIESGDSDAQIEAFLQQAFTAPLTLTHTIRRRSATLTAVKSTSSVLSSKPPRPTKMQGSKPQSSAKPSLKASPKKMDTTKADVSKESVPELPKSPSQSAASGAIQLHEQKQPPIKTKLLKRSPKANVKKHPSAPERQKSESALLLLKQGKSDADRAGPPILKASARQISLNKLPLNSSNRKQDVDDQKIVETATESIVQPKLEDKANKAEPKPKTPVKSTSKSTAAASKTNVRNPVSVKKSAPLTKASKST